MPETARTIILETKNQYGRETLRVVSDSPYAKAVQTLTHKVTVDQPDILALKELGFEVVVKETPARKL